MTKRTAPTGDAPAADPPIVETPAVDTPIADAPADSEVDAGEPHPTHDRTLEWPSEGGSFIRQPDGTLVRAPEEN